MIDCINRHLELYERRDEPYRLYNNSVYRLYKGTVRPFGPAKFDYTLKKKDAFFLLNSLGGKMTVCTSGFQPGSIGEWYCMVCDRFMPLEEYKQSHRYEMRRGLKDCVVRQIDADYLALHGYEVYVKAYSRYRGEIKPALDETQFNTYFNRIKGYEDIVHCWGVFNSNTLVAYAVNDIFDRIEAMYHTIKFDPAYSKSYPVYALLHEMNRYYLDECGFEYVNDGWRSIAHETGMQEFIKKFGFRPAYTRLQVIYRPWLAAAVRCVYPFRAQLGRFHPGMKTLMLIESIRRSYL